MENTGIHTTNDCTDETVLTTPQPRASSTLHRQQQVKKFNLNKIPLSFSPTVNTTLNSTANSLSILNADNLKIHSIVNQNDQNVSQSVSEKWEDQRAFANSILEKSKRLGLPSRYLRASDSFRTSACSVGSDSTVNESDLLTKDKITFDPEEISTPRSSCMSAAWGKLKTSFAKENKAMLSGKIKSSDISLAELCNQYCNLELNMTNTQFSCNEDSFVPGELAAEKLAEGERSWRRELNVLGEKSLRGDSVFSTYDPSMSVSDFFKKKSELAELCFKKSPEKQVAPVPLIEKSVAIDTAEESNINPTESESILDLSEIERALLHEDKTVRVVEIIAKTRNKRSHVSSKENFKRPSATAMQLSTKLASQKSFEPLKDSRNITRETAYLDNSNSMHTASSLDSLPGGKLPIETNRIELVWGCVRTGKRKFQTFTLRNKSHNKLRLQISSSNTCFRILNEHSELESVSVLPILMYPTESRTFTVAFIPTTVGAVVGKLNFTPVNSELQAQQQKRQMLMMFGYGGHANVEIENVLKDTNMKMWLSLGKLDNMPQLTQKFNLKNVGNLSAFACLKFNSKMLYESSKVTIYPSALVLHPKEQTCVNLTYIPTKDDAKHLFAMTNSQVMEIGTVKIIMGAEAVRGRIRRLCSKLKQETGRVENHIIEELSHKFPNEKMPKDLNQFTETVGSVKELLQNFDVKEITITLEKDSERTLVGQIGGIDEASMFQSLCEGMTTIAIGRNYSSTCLVEPTNIILTPPNKITDAVVLTNQCNSPLQFETVIEPAGVLDVAPSEGVIKNNKPTLISISCNTRKLKEQKYFKLSVYVDNDVYEVDIKVIFLKP